LRDWDGGWRGAEITKYTHRQIEIDGQNRDTWRNREIDIDRHRIEKERYEQNRDTQTQTDYTHCRLDMEK